MFWPLDWQFFQDQIQLYPSTTWPTDADFGPLRADGQPGVPIAACVQEVTDYRRDEAEGAIFGERQYIVLLPIDPTTIVPGTDWRIDWVGNASGLFLAPIILGSLPASNPGNFQTWFNVWMIQCIRRT